MKNFYIIIFILWGLSYSLYAQPALDIEPRRVIFEDIFNRLDYTTFINRGDQVLRIDSMISYNGYYLLDFDDAQQLPVFINPGDTLKLNITLTNFYDVTVTDTTDTIWVHTNDPESPRDLRIKIDFFNDDYGDCTGNVSDDSAVPLPDSKLYFFYYGVYLFDSTYTDLSGNYNIKLPKGSYTIAAEKEGHRVMFSGDTPDPYFAQTVSLDSGNAVNVDLILPPVRNTGYSVSGVVMDSSYGYEVNKGVVVVRKGTHTPTLQKRVKAAVTDSSVYAGFIKPDGSYSITVEDSGYFFVQGYSNNFLPAYYNDENAASVFWQNADSLLLNEPLISKDLYLKRDSSYGGGSVYGKISLPVEGYEGITVLARSVDNRELYSYNFGKEDGQYSVSSLPYGTYELVAQRIGFENAVSSVFTISPDYQHVYNIDIQFPLSGVDEEETNPSGIKLYPNYPNPFNPETTIGFYLPRSGRVAIKVYNILGVEAATILDEEKSAGAYELKWNAGNLPSGIYFYRLISGKTVQTGKMVLLK